MLFTQCTMAFENSNNFSYIVFLELRSVCCCLIGHCLSYCHYLFREILQGVYDNLIVVKPLQSFNEHNLFLIGRPNLGITYTKLYCWKLVQFSKCVFLDADTIVSMPICFIFSCLLR